MDVTAPEHTLMQVQTLLERRRTQHARALLRSALLNHPEHTGLLLQWAWVDYLDDDSEQARATVQQVLASEPHNASARELYFELLAEAKEFGDAEEVILGLLRDFPEAAHYYGRYAIVMLDTLNLAKARQLAQEGLKYDPDDTECLAAQTLCDFIEQRDGASSEGLRQLLLRHPQSQRTLFLVLVALEQKGDLVGARRVSEELVRAQPDNESLVAAAHQLRLNTHWSMKPLWPLQRFGWAGSVGLWLIAVIGLRTLKTFSPTVAGVAGILVAIYVIYSWVWPPILKRIIRP